MSILTVRNLSHYYPDGDYRRYVLKDINFDFEKGKFYTILGQSGSGKTTFLSLLAAMDSVQEGAIEYEGKSFNKYDLNTIRRNLIGMVFQGYNLIPYMTAVENVMVAMTITENEMPDDKQDIAYNLLDYLGITKTKADRLVTKVSGGEQQRVAIARALATNVEVILADEPTGNVDEDTETEIISIFKKLAHDHNKCVIVVTHSPLIAAEADVVLTLRKGNFILDE
ncbi:ABC transporter ATP-binding protein [Dethiobacter alkaliphilus]|uniref:ABC transporter ATP-binding protein n=1 Tax=Dethiobacter alkaliphilus TaxID=427926 RepID=UPI0022267429|nr:ABC transporter ATP-binding protein [Dethiobacter alkaliphilus]MCW3488536.1 ABC transporter ATP-binding protein [Dethiobacter alkaliphilus]